MFLPFWNSFWLTCNEKKNKTHTEINEYFLMSLVTEGKKKFASVETHLLQMIIKYFPTKKCDKLNCLSEEKKYSVGLY